MEAYMIYLPVFGNSKIVLMHVATEEMAIECINHIKDKHGGSDVMYEKVEILTQ